MPRFRILIPLGIGLLMALAAVPGGAAEGSAGVTANLTGPLPPAASAVRARQLLSAGQTDQAERMVRTALAAGADAGTPVGFRRNSFPPGQLRGSGTGLRGCDRVESGQCPRLVGIGANRTGAFPAGECPRFFREGLFPESPRHRHHSVVRGFRQRPGVEIDPAGECGAAVEFRPAGTGSRRRRPTADPPAVARPCAGAAGEPVCSVPAGARADSVPMARLWRACW